MPEAAKLWTPGFVLLNLQFMLVTGVLALFFPFHAYLESLGLSQAAAGLILGADALAALIVQPLIAMRIHPANARRWLAGGALLFALALFLISQASALLPLLGARLLQGAGFSALVAALIALMVEQIPTGMSGRAFGLISLARLLPYAAIPPLLDLLGVLPTDFGRLLGLAILLALAPMALMWLPQAATPQASGTASTAPGRAGIRQSLGSRPVAWLLLASLLLYGGYAVTFYFLRALGTSLGMDNSGLFFSLATLATLLIRLLGGALFDRYDKIHFSLLGFLMVLIAHGLMPVAATPWLFLGLGVLLGLGWGILIPLQSALMFDLSSPSGRALNQNLLLATMQAGFFFGPTLGGVLLAHTGFPGLFGTLAFTSLLAALATLGAGRT